MPVLFVALFAATALAACGGNDQSTTAADGGEAKVSGEFAAVPDAPADYSEVGGEAEIERADGGTTVSLAISGLQPKTAYMAHLHSGGCDLADPGGPHFQFEKGGAEEPPNEIHLHFTSDAAGEGEAEASSKMEVPAGEAGSVVVHLADPDHAMSAIGAAEAETVFVHEGVDHSEEGGHMEGGDHMEDGGRWKASTPTATRSPAPNSKALRPPKKAKRRRAGMCRRSSSATANRSAGSRSSNTAPAKRSDSGSSPTRRKRSTSTATT